MVEAAAFRAPNPGARITGLQPRPSPEAKAINNRRDAALVILPFDPPWFRFARHRQRSQGKRARTSIEGADGRPTDSRGARRQSSR